MNRLEIGDRAEEIALDYEFSRLKICGASKFVTLVSDNTSLGYDIESIDSVGHPVTPRFIEVKAFGSSNTFFISKNEMERLGALGELAFLYLVDVNLGQVVHEIRNPVAKGVFKNAEVCKLKIVY
ncbi:MAG: DUF3883 domain-containing protein [Bdellovibrionaceae bacterium]|nr:DUF3883 domain-containing protein [Pseudobdellovibrionaceae bacterium]